ncbi:MAG: hypothetical protein ACO3DK_06240 [Bacteroidia bacterium]
MQNPLDSAEYTAFQLNVFVWEIVFGAVVFAAVIWVLKRYKKNSDAASERNKKYRSQ